MRHVHLALPVLGILAVAALDCSRSRAKRGSEEPPDAALAPTPAASTPPPLPRGAPLGEDAPLNLNQPDIARVQLDLAVVRGAIREYKMLNEAKNPPDLSSLHVKLFFPGDLTYDAGSGTVKSRTYPAF